MLPWIPTSNTPSTKFYKQEIAFEFARLTPPIKPVKWSRDQVLNQIQQFEQKLLVHKQRSVQK